MTKRMVDPPDLEAFDAAHSDDKRNRMLLDWLSDDGHRTTLYALINAHRQGRLEFPSRDSAPRECDCEGIDSPLKPPNTGHKTVTMITRRATISTALGDKGSIYSNRVYAELGGGSFMLALDPQWTGAAHAQQLKAFHECFPRCRNQIIELSHLACQASSIMALQAPEFDLADFARQSALRFCEKLMGYAFKDYPLLESALFAAYRALVFQVLGRHFVTDPIAIPLAKTAMGRLLARTSELIDAYDSNDTDALKGCEDTALPRGLTPVLKKLGALQSELNGAQRAIVAMGAAIGTVGNVQAAACIAVKGLFAAIGTPGAPDAQADNLWDQAHRLALSEPATRPTDHYDAWQTLIQGMLSKNPPIPFVPRLIVDANGNSTGEVILALGGGTCNDGWDDPLIWGLPDDGTHNCAGKALAWPLIVEIVRQTMALPGLAERLDAQDATPIGLKKRWGFDCESYPLTFRRESRVAQASLNVAMRLKAPVKDSADLVRAVIRAGAPRIEQALRQAPQVHFAWFELIESDTVLVLHTVYDGPFAAYIQHFALKVGDLFDELFSHIENPPPMPIEKFPDDFVAHILRYNRAPAAGYFFSAYPRSEVSSIIRDQLARP